jgi:hypothetical protein
MSACRVLTEGHIREYQSNILSRDHPVTVEIEPIHTNDDDKCCSIRLLNLQLKNEKSPLLDLSHKYEEKALDEALQ